MKTEARIKVAEEAIRAHGFTLHYVQFCEDAETPGILGSISGATSHDKRKVKIATNRRTRKDIAETLEHELRHIEEPLWDCGSHNVFGSPSGAQLRQARGKNHD